MKKNLISHTNLNSIKKILIQRADKMGDTILALPVVQHLKLAYPAIQVDFLTSGIGAKIVSDHPLITNVWVREHETLETDMIAQKYDAVIHLYEDIVLAKLSKKINIPIRIGTAERWPLRFYYTHRVNSGEGDITQHTVLKNLAFLKPFNISTQLIRPLMAIQETAKEEFKALRKKYVPSDKQLLSICLATGGSNQAIPIEDIRAFVSHLDPDLYRVVFIGPPEFQEIVSGIKQHTQRCLFVSDFQLSFAALAASQFYVGPDTGYTHIASAYNIPSLVFSPMKSLLPTRWGSLSATFEIIRKDYLCHHIGRQACADGDIEKQIDLNELTDRFHKLVDSTIKKQALSIADIQLKHLKSSLRIILISTTRAEYDVHLEYARNARSYGAYFFPLYIPHFSHRAFPVLRRAVENKNISIIHGRIPISWYLYLKFHMQIRLGYFAPKVVTHIDWNPQITPEEYLEIYKNVWKA